LPAGRLAIMARPRAEDWLDDEIAGWKLARLDLIVCLLEPDEVVELSLQREVMPCEARGIAFMSFPIPNRGVPRSMRGGAALGEIVASGVAGGRSIAVHCRAGIGRSSVIAACALICAGSDTDRAFAQIRNARGIDVPDTPEQRDWVVAFERAYRSGAAL
jgi:protein-tyrosine phosphatase